MTMKRTNYEKPTQKKTTQQFVKKRIVNVLKYLCIQFTFIFTYCSVCFASEEYAKNGASWFLDQLFWVALVVVIVVMLKLFAARNFVAGVVTVLVGGVVCYFIKNPESIETIGNVAAKALGLQ